MSRPSSSPLPIDPILPDLVEALRRHSNLVLRAATGAGKTTRVPPTLLDADLAGSGRILLLEPRRLAARAAAARIADERAGRLGEEIGYHVRFDRCASPHTRLLVVTPGILLRLLHDDPYLETTGVVVFDEFHERSLEVDLALGLVRLIQQTVRPELRLVVMSATLAAEPIAEYLGGCPVVQSEGRLFPVTIRYEPRPHGLTWPAAAAAATERVLAETDGSVLVFLPGLQEIRQTARHLETAAAAGVAVLPLHGDLPPEQQDAALGRGPQGSPRRKVVLATNVAETSVTVEGVTGVVDTGLARSLVFDPHVGLDRLELAPVSRASTEQRAGRAGRTQAGICVRLWSEAAQRSRPAETEPEVRRVDLAGAVLQLLSLGETDILRFPWLEPPPATTVEQALALLQRLGAVQGRAITEQGRLLARLPCHPRVGRLLVEGYRLGQLERVALAGALLSERDPFDRSPDAPPRPGPRTATHSDVLDRVEALEAFARSGHLESPAGTLHRNAARQVLRVAAQLTRVLRHETRHDHVKRGEPVVVDEAVLRSLVAAFPDRVARRRSGDGRRGLLVGGRGVRLAPSSRVTEGELFLCLDVDDGGTEALVRLASIVQRDWLSADLLHSGVEVAFDEEAERVVARKRVRYEDLVLEESQAALPGAEEIASVLLSAALARPERVLPPEDSPAGLYRTRVRCLRAWLPRLDLPAFDTSDLGEVLPWLCGACRSFAELRAADWLTAMQQRLTHAQRHAVEREAPERIAVPSGSYIALRYEEGRPPVLAVRIQELFGLAQTPCIASGRVPVLLHLLAPNYRPQQVTDDLASFWDNTYPLVRKELRARYPRHAWPEDPRAAAPESRPRRRPPT